VREVGLIPALDSFLVPINDLGPTHQWAGPIGRDREREEFESAGRVTRASPGKRAFPLDILAGGRCTLILYGFRGGVALKTRVPTLDGSPTEVTYDLREIDDVRGALRDPFVRTR